MAASGSVSGSDFHRRWCGFVTGVAAGVATWLCIAVRPGLAAEPAAAPVSAAEQLLTVTMLTVEQARQIIREQEAKPRFPTEGGEAEVRAALAAVGASPKEIDRLLLHNDEVFQKKKSQGSLANWYRLRVSDLAQGETEVRRLLLSQDGDYGVTANRFADFLHLGLRDVPADVAEVLGEFKGSLCLPRLQRLESAPLARALASRKLLVLRAVSEIGAAAAAALAEGDAHIEAPLLMSLASEPLARKLAARAELVLPHLRALGPAAAKGLAVSRGTIALPELRTLTPEAARALAESEATIRLQALAPTPEVADILTRGRVKVAVSQLTGDFPALLEKMADSQQSVSVESQALSEASLRALGKFGGSIALSNVRTVTPDQAAALAALPGLLHMSGLEAVTSVPLTEKLIGEGRGQTAVVFNRLTQLSPEVAALLVGSAGESLELPALKPDAESLRILATLPGDLVLGLQSLGPVELEALADARCRSLSLGVKELSPEVVRQVQRLPIPVRLPAVWKLSDEAIAALADGPERLTLPGLNVASLSADRVERLVATTPVDGPFWRQITRLTVATAAGIGRRPGPVVLSKLESIDGPDAVEIAAKLAAKRGGLSLPALKRLSPKTLSALVVKEDIGLPPIANLELILEPDGSATEDFVIPAGLEDRLQRQPPPRQGR